MKAIKAKMFATLIIAAMISGTGSALLLASGEKADPEAVVLAAELDSFESQAKSHKAELEASRVRVEAEKAKMKLLEAEKDRQLAHIRTPEGARLYAKDLAYKTYGWGDEQFACLDKLWVGESGWKHTAQNPISTAYGIAQFLNSTWKLVGFEKSDNPAIQIEAGLKYIKVVYGSPCNAWSKWLARSPHWY